MSCTRCSKSQSTVQAFLLTCYDCSRKWHHRCHIPPVSDQELVSRIKAHNAGDMANGLQAWKCKRCTRGGSTVSGTPAPAPRALAGPSLYARAQTSSVAPTRTSATSGGDQDVVVIDDSDSDAPSSQPPKTAKPSTLKPRPPKASSLSSDGKTSKAIKSVSHPSKPVHPLAREEEESSDSAQRAPLPPQPPSQSQTAPLSARNQTRRSAADDATGDVSLTGVATPRPRKKRASETAMGSSQRAMMHGPSLSLQEKEIQREAFKRQAMESEKRKRLDHKRRQAEFIRAKSEEKEAQLEQLTTDVVDLSLGTPARTVLGQSHSAEPPYASPQIFESTAEADLQASPVVISTIRPAAESMSQKEPELDLLPQWIHAQESEGDIWDRALRKKASAAPPSHPRRKFQAQRLGDAKPNIYHFNSYQWLEGMRRGLR